MTSIQELAAATSAQFERGLRPDNTGEPIWIRKSTACDWVMDMCHDAHNQDLPNDWTYRFIVASLDNIADMNDPTNYDEQNEQIDATVSIYGHKLMCWAADGHSHYVDEAQQEGMIDPDAPFDRRLAVGQYQHISEVFRDVLAALETQLEEMEAA